MLLTKEEILAEEAIHAGTIRHTIHNSDGDEGVSLTNMMAILAHHCTDYIGNRFGAYIIVPPTYWQKMRRDWQDTQGKDPNLLPRNIHGGYMGLFPYVTVYVAEGLDNVVILKPDVGTLSYAFIIGDEHKLIWNKDKLIARYGYEAVGYDNRLPYVPWFEFPYAPPQLLLAWVKDDGFKPALALLENPPLAAIKQWVTQGFISAPEDLKQIAAPIDYEEGSAFLEEEE